MEAFHQLSPSEFLARYDFGRPRTSGFVRVVTHCKSGVRAAAAADILRLLDFSDVAVYKGSMNDWAGRGGTVKKEQS